jgi:hypothetical protein
VNKRFKSGILLVYDKFIGGKIMKGNKQEPIIILGMHRSGTTMICKHLEQLGVFMGNKKDGNNEALFFLDFNNWVLRQVDARWDMPQNYFFLDKHPVLKNEILDAANYSMSSIRSVQYIGLKNYFKYRSIKRLNFPWGWKDPRNSFTIDLWKEIFPGAKLIHIYRHPLDVARSLQKREIRSMEQYQSNLKVNIKKKLAVKKLGYNHSILVTNILNGIKLWEQYVHRCDQMVTKYGGLTIKYENYLDNPQLKLKEIIEYVGINPKINVSKFNVKVDSSKKYSFTQDQELSEVYSEIKNSPMLRHFGYDHSK